MDGLRYNTVPMTDSGSRKGDPPKTPTLPDRPVSLKPGHDKTIRDLNLAIVPPKNATLPDRPIAIPGKVRTAPDRPSAKAEPLHPRWIVLDAALERHACADAREASDVARIRAFLRDHAADAHLRTQLLGHLTGSGFVLDSTKTKVLLLHHARLLRWLQPGGHGEGELDFRQVCLREIAEETGLAAADLTALVPKGAPAYEAELFDVDIHPIPLNDKRKEPAHEHLDLRFAFVAREGAEPKVSEESTGLKWLPLSELPENADAAMKRAFGKLRAAVQG